MELSRNTHEAHPFQRAKNRGAWRGGLCHDTSLVRKHTQRNSKNTQLDNETVTKKYSSLRRVELTNNSRYDKIRKNWMGMYRT